MKFIDLHCDTASRMFNDKENIGLFSNELSVDINKLKRGDSLAQVFALFVNLKYENPYEYCRGMAENFLNEVNRNRDDIALARNYDEIMENKKDGKLSAILSIEEGGVLEGSMDNLRKFYDIGVRMMTLTWNYKNEIGYPNKDFIYKDIGLTPFGHEVVEYMNELGMIVDVSHLSDGGFYDVAECCRGPFIASHSNARGVTCHPRNLTDDMIRILGNRGGAAGINFCGAFMGDHGDNTYIADMINHIKYMANIGGIESVAIGTDFDGISSKVELNNSGEMGKLADALNKSGFSYDSIEKIFYKNALRVIRDVMKEKS